MEQLLDLFDKEPDKQALSLFLNWFRQLAARGYIPIDDFAKVEQEYRTKEEVTSRLVKALERKREAIRQQGIAIGEARRKEERNREIIRAMAKKGVALPLIAEVTQLPMEVINQLLAKKQSNNHKAPAAQAPYQRV